MCVQVTGEANENQLCEALRRYKDRECFLRGALVHLYNLTTDSDEPRPETLKVLSLPAKVDEHAMDIFSVLNGLSHLDLTFCSFYGCYFV